MPLLIILLLWFIIRRLTRPRKKPVDYEKIRLQEQREQERREKAMLRQIELNRKRQEQEQKKQAARNAAIVKSKQLELLVAEYAKYIQSLQLELEDSNISITRYNQIQKEILRAQEKITKYGNDANKLYFDSRL